MSHQRLFPSFPVPHFGHFFPAGKPPVPIVPPGRWWTGSSYALNPDEDVDFPLKSKMFQRTGFQYLGGTVTGVVKWYTTTIGDVQ